MVCITMNVLLIQSLSLLIPYFLCLPCSHWEAFHTCALTALSDCQEEVGPIWETLREDSRKIRFQGSLFDLCAPSSSPFLRASLTTLPLPLLAGLIMSVAAYAWSGLVSRPPVPPPSADPDLFTLYSPLSTKIVKPRISLSNLMFVNQTLLTSLISTRLTS